MEKLIRSRRVLKDYDFWYWHNCIRTMKFKDGEWFDDGYPVKFWMTIPRIPKEDE